MIAANFDVVAGVDAEAPGLRAVAVECDGNQSEGTEYEQQSEQQFDAISGFTRKCPAADRDALLAAQER